VNAMKLDVALVAALVLACLAAPARLRSEVAELHGTADPTGEKPTPPRDAVPVPVIPDKMAVPAPTAADRIRQATPPAEIPGLDAGSPGIPEQERKEVVPPPARGR